MACRLSLITQISDLTCPDRLCAAFSSPTAPSLGPPGVCSVCPPASLPCARQRPMPSIPQEAGMEVSSWRLPSGAHAAFDDAAAPDGCSKPLPALRFRSGPTALR
ncbi:hypothetical protein BD626DRAFT_483978 [Schizophyllum amplum]|uniref:Uncharacterized protein n=1 Tax=Schizophyllum amplum TaxID=97359 RepID=A0A550CPX0_9AGAR|nr:hypothetical protein BD626DRAFT_483978 [Auriculariopsis ampla]